MSPVQYSAAEARSSSGWVAAKLRNAALAWSYCARDNRFIAESNSRLGSTLAAEPGADWAERTVGSVVSAGIWPSVPGAGGSGRKIGAFGSGAAEASAPFGVDVAGSPGRGTGAAFA